MNPAKTTTRLPALLYSLMGMTGVFSLQVFPAMFIVHGDATATARRIADDVFAYRIWILSDLICNVSFVFLALSLYHHLKNIDKKQARLLVVLVSISAAIGIANELNQVAPLTLLSGAKYLSVFTKPQLDALALGFLGLRSSALGLNSAFWGLWLLPFGVLVVKSGFIPKILGFCLIVGGFGYLTTCFVSIAFPAYRPVVYLFMLPLNAIGEVPIFLWLLVKGMRISLPEAQPSDGARLPVHGHPVGP